MKNFLVVVHRHLCCHRLLILLLLLVHFLLDSSWCSIFLKKKSRHTSPLWLAQSFTPLRSSCRQVGGTSLSFIHEQQRHDHRQSCSPSSASIPTTRRNVARTRLSSSLPWTRRTATTVALLLPTAVTGETQVLVERTAEEQETETNAVHHRHGVEQLLEEVVAEEESSSSSSLMTNLVSTTTASNGIRVDDKHIIRTTINTSASISSSSTTFDINSGHSSDHHHHIVIDNLPLLDSDELAPIRLRNGAQVGKFAYRIGLSTSLTKYLESFLESSGIHDMFRVLLTQNSLDPDESILVENETNGKDCVWNVQRPRAHWKNNMHWISPAGEEAQNQFLDALYSGGFAKTLRAIGKEFGFGEDDMTIHHAFFIGVSRASNSYTHQDFVDTGGRGFTMLIPLRLVGGKHAYAEDYDNNNVNNQQGKTNGDRYDDDGDRIDNTIIKTIPELGFQSDALDFYAWYKYKIGEAALVGDGTWHVTADCDYTFTNDYRICANIYVCHKNHPIHEAINSKGVYVQRRK